MPTPLVIVSIPADPPRSTTGHRAPLADALTLLAVEAGEALLLSPEEEMEETLEGWISRFGAECGARLVAFDFFDSPDQTVCDPDTERAYRELLMPLAPAWGPPDFFPPEIREELKRRDLSSVVLLPTSVKGVLWGTCRLEYDTVRLDFTLDEISAMTRVVRVLAASIRSEMDRMRPMRSTQRRYGGMTRREFLEAEARTGAEQLIQSCVSARNLFRQSDVSVTRCPAVAETEPALSDMSAESLTLALSDLSDSDREIWSSAVEALDGLFGEISGHWEQHQKLKGVLEETWRMQEDQRQEISHDLHERLAQDIAASKLLCDLVKKNLPESRVDLLDGLDRISDVLQKSVTALKSIAYRLHPPDLQELGLEQALQMLCMELGRKGEIAIRFSPVALERLMLSPETGIQVYRVVEEVLLASCEQPGLSTIDLKAVVSGVNLILRFETSERLRLSARAESRIRLLGGKIRQAGRKRPAVVLELPISRKELMDGLVMG